MINADMIIANDDADEGSYVIHLNAIGGSLASDVVVRTEVQWDCWVAATRKKDANYTNDIAIQIDINT